jgi:hypothetical protein
MPTRTNQKLAVGFLRGKPMSWLSGSIIGGSVLLLGGCSEERIDLHPTTGTIRFGETVPAGAQIVLHPRGHVLPPEAIPTAQVADDGSFVLGTYNTGDGAPAGAYKATVQWFKVVKSEGGAGRGPNVLPRSYADPQATPLSVTVAEGQNTIPTIEIEANARGKVAARTGGTLR